MNVKMYPCLVLIWLLTTSLYAFSGIETDTISDHSSKLVTAKQVLLEELEKEFPLLTPQKSRITTPEFTHELLASEYPNDNKILPSRQEVAAVFQDIETKSRWVDTFRNEDIQTLPIGITYTPKDAQGNTDDGVTVQLGLVSATVNTEYIEFAACARIVIPQTDKDGKQIELFFAANNLKMSHNGGIIGDANLVLLGDVHIPWNGGKWLLTLKGGMNKNTGNIQNLTYFNMDCDGLKELGIQADIQFSRDMILPVGYNGETLPETRTYKGADGKNRTVPNRVTGSFGMVVSGWNDIIAEVNLPPFVLASMPQGFMFSSNRAIFDFSDERTLHNNFPQFYHDNGLLFPSVESWRGFYVESLSIGMPEPFQTKESISKKQRVFFDAYHMIIDDYGLSGYFTVSNVIPLSEGRTNKSNAWAMSVDQLGIELAANRFIGATFDGRILLPISDKLQEKVQTQNTTKNDSTQIDSRGLAYSGLISEDEFSLRLSTLNEIKFNIWKAQARLAANSAVELAVREGSFRPKAILHGDMTISTGIGEKTNTTDKEVKDDTKGVSFKGIEFQDLVLQTESPIFQVGYFGYRGEVKLMNFPVSIADIALTATDTHTALGFDLRLNLMGKKDKGFAAETRLELFGKIKEENYKQRWKFDKVALRRIYLNASLGVFSMEGELHLMENDPEYGDGFAADLSLQFKNIFKDGLQISAKAMFGKKDFRYWYVDAMVDNLPTGESPLIGVKGFGGGAFYKMKRRSFGSAFSPSGLGYIPDANSRLGLKAMILFSVFNQRVVNGGAGFEILFNRNGGVNKMGIYGEAYIMKMMDIPNPAAAITDKLKDIADHTGVGDALSSVADKKVLKPFIDKAKDDYKATIPGQAGISSYVGIEFDFQNSALHGEFETYVNVAGGMIQGRSAGGLSGKAVIHLSSDEWYLHLGTPEQRQGLAFSVGPYRQESGGYFMVGNYILPSPPPPPEVADILGVEAETLNYMRDENALSSGKGFAFGQDFKVDTGDIHFLMLYARFMAGAGYDIMLRDYGEAQCANTGDQVGIDGWYANGQAYAYLQGELGIRIKLFFVKKKIPIIKGGAAVLLQAKAPNPIWMRGYVGGYYDLLGGLVKGRFRFKLTLGEECEFTNASPINGVKMITDLTPTDGANDVDVFAAPQATFSMRVGEPLVIPEDDGDKTYKVILEKFRIVDMQGKEIVGSMEWGDYKDRVTFFSDDILPPTTKLKAEIEVSFQEKINGIFKTIMVDGKKAVETEVRNFTTGTAPNHIPLHNIEYGYPIVEQQQVYRKEYPKGYVQLKRGQDYLFDDTNWKTEILTSDESGASMMSKFNYNNATNEVQYTLPKLEKSTKYLYSIISSPKNGGGSNQNNTITKTDQINADNTVEITTTAANNISQDGSIDRLSYEYTTSKHNTFTDKIKALRVTNHTWNTTLSSEIVFLASNLKQYDGFDLIELFGNTYTEEIPLVSIEADLADTYFTADIDPTIYKQYPQGGKYKVDRDVSVYGFRPKKALHVRNFYDVGVHYQKNKQLRETTFPYLYNLPLYYYLDFRAIEKQVLNDVVDGKVSLHSATGSILKARYLYMRKGNYRSTLSYRLPGGKKISKVSYTFKHTNNFR